MFKHVVRIADTDLDGNKPLLFALTGVTGIGIRMAQCIINELNLDPEKKIGELEEENIKKLKKFIEQEIEKLPPWLLNRRKDPHSGKDLHLLAKDVELARMLDVDNLIKIRCYRGMRHARGKKVRGQRTRTTGRRGRTIGVQRKKK